MISIVDLVKQRDTRPVLAGICLEFAKGEVVALVGASGGGKSTILRCINGLDEFDGGEIRAFGSVLRPGRGHAPSLLAVRRRVGFVFQHFNLFAHRSALGNIIEAPVHVAKVPVAQATERAHTLLAKVGMSHRALAYPHELSGGEQQRVAIARALAMDPDVLLLDEPTSALDHERKGEVLTVLTKLAQEGTTMLIVTHEMSFARDVAHRILVLDQGRIMADGKPEDVLQTRHLGSLRCSAPPGPNDH